MDEGSVKSSTPHQFTSSVGIATERDHQELSSKAELLMRQHNV